MRTVLIDAEKREIRELEIDTGDGGLHDAQKAVGGYVERAVTLTTKDDVYVDEEGLLKPKKGGFAIQGASQPFHGNGIVIGVRGTKWVGAKATVAQMQALVRFF